VVLVGTAFSRLEFNAVDNQLLDHCGEYFSGFTTFSSISLNQKTLTNTLADVLS